MDLPDAGMEPGPLALQADSLLTEAPNVSKLWPVLLKMHYTLPFYPYFASFPH